MAWVKADLSEFAVGDQVKYVSSSACLTLIGRVTRVHSGHAQNGHRPIRTVVFEIQLKDGFPHGGSQKFMVNSATIRARWGTLYRRS